MGLKMFANMGGKICINIDKIGFKYGCKKRGNMSTIIQFTCLQIQIQIHGTWYILVTM